MYWNYMHMALFVTSVKVVVVSGEWRPVMLSDRRHTSA